ncbi:hypothetical protein Shyd_18660 [Streptomyces hydrogenans]|uniref:Uncharacterized protein n=1 Tax=Streptomyces hydrogenans TaxID=1873719 RepID=A0ABQ3P649_9ACTN|nr:hypothetical protein Shyd_18660 [Streptomyces hydrogenans]
MRCAAVNRARSGAPCVSVTSPRPAASPTCAQRIRRDLEEAVTSSPKVIGRRTHCTLRPEGRLRHPAEALLSVGALLELFSADEGEPVRARGGTGVDARKPTGILSAPLAGGGR